MLEKEFVATLFDSSNEIDSVEDSGSDCYSDSDDDLEAQDGNQGGEVPSNFQIPKQPSMQLNLP